MFNFGYNFFGFSNPFMNFFMPFNPYNMAFQWQTNNSIFTANKFNQDMPYNKAKGEALARNAIAGLPSTPPETPLCARYVKNAIVNTGLGSYINGNGEQTKYMLRQNLNFKEVKVKGEDLANLPAGSVVVYDAFDKGTYSDGNPFQIGKNGHTLIAKGDGTGISDRPEDSIIPSDRAYAFIPV